MILISSRWISYAWINLFTLCVYLDLQWDHLLVFTPHWPMFNHPLVGTTSPIIPSFESFNSLRWFVLPAVSDFLDTSVSPKVLTNIPTRSSRPMKFVWCKWLISFSRALARATSRHLDHGSLGRWWYQDSVRGMNLRAFPQIPYHLGALRYTSVFSGHEFGVQDPPPV